MPSFLLSQYSFLKAGSVPSFYAYCCLDTARAAAAKFLAPVADGLEGKAAEHVSRAAALYQQVVDLLREKREDLPEPWMMFPWDLERIGGWTREHRHCQACVLREAASLEEQAVAEIESALRTIGRENRRAVGQLVVDDRQQLAGGLKVASLDRLQDTRGLVRGPVRLHRRCPLILCGCPRPPRGRTGLP